MSGFEINWPETDFPTVQHDEHNWIEFKHVYFSAPKTKMLNITAGQCLMFIQLFGINQIPGIYAFFAVKLK